MMQDTCNDLLAEYFELAELCATLTPSQWRFRSEFYDWTPWDEIAHLCYFDEAALQSVRDPERFAEDAALLNERVARGEKISALARETYGGLDAASLLVHWRAHHAMLVDALRGTDPKARLAWYGPAMSVRSFATARLMETWAHGQDVWDVVRRKRPASARLQHVAHLGVTTFGWTFVNRGLPVPSVAPYVELAAPMGGNWSWGNPDATDFVRGTAEDFCLIVTQRRHVDDTGLRYSEGPVQQWLRMAQCFAGPPADGPPPCVRKAVR
jgi:uncharacterized protein (TIGR03084 family)